MEGLPKDVLAIVLSYAIQESVHGSYVNYSDPERILDLATVCKSFCQALKGIATVRSILDEHFCFKVVLMGGGHGGKTTLLRRGAEEEPVQQVYYLQRGGHRWQVADDLPLGPGLDSAFRRCQGAIIMFGMDDRTGFEAMFDMMDAVLRYKDLRDFPIALVANKMDLETPVVAEDELPDLKRLSNRFLRLFKISCKSGDGVEELWKDFGDCVCAYGELNKKHRKLREKESKASCLVC